MIKPSCYGIGKQLALALVILLVLGGCGGDDESLPSTLPLTDIGLSDDQIFESLFASVPASNEVPSTPQIEPTDTPAIDSGPRLKARLAEGAVVGQAPFMVNFTNLSENADTFQWDFGDGDVATTSHVDEPISHQYVKAGSYKVTLTAATSGPTQSKAITSVTVVVQPGPLHRIIIQPDILTLSVAAQDQFTVSAFDRFGNLISGLSTRLWSDEIAGKVDDSGAFKAGTQPGVYEAGVTVEVTQGTVTKTASAGVTVAPGPLAKVLLHPEAVELNIGESHEFTARAVDAYDNPLPNARLTWQVAETIGTISEEGVLTAGTVAGTYKNGVTAALLSIEATASVTIVPDPPVEVKIPAILVSAGESVNLEALVINQHGNPVQASEVVWSVQDANAGSITGPSLFIAGELARTYQDAIRANVRSVELGATVSVTVLPGPLQLVAVAPQVAEIGIGMTQQFVAVGVDRFGNRISGLDIAWRMKNDIGNIDADGLFTAGENPVATIRAIEATATQSGVNRSGDASVSIEPDQVAFISDRNDGQPDVYVMNMDGSDLRRVTTGATPVVFSWSPDGRRIVSDFGFFANRYIVATNDDGQWDVLLTNLGLDAGPVWSPDGRKVAFVSTREGNADIYLMDVDGSNPIRVTNHPAADQNPAWSPDGKKVVFASERDGNLEIYVVNLADGSVNRLTDRRGTDSHPSWSPNGKEIVFRSNQDGDSEIYLMNSDGTEIRKLTSNLVEDTSPSWSIDGERIIFTSGDQPADWEIYTMSRLGDQVTRLTSNQDLDFGPRWAPRKRGVAVGQASIVTNLVPPRSLLTDQTVASRVGDALVRIQTPTGAGSGIVIDSGGLILTNNHLTRGTQKVLVFLKDGIQHNGSVVGRDLLRNLAVVRIEASGLDLLELGDVSQVQVGSAVVVVRSPLGAGDTTSTLGRVSALKVDGGRNIHWIQTDIPLGSEKSGAPLVSLQGEVIGLVDPKAVDVGLDGAGFAISANTIKLYLDRLIAGEVIAN